MPAVPDFSDEFGGVMRPFRKHFGTPAFEHSMGNVFGPIVSENLIPGGANRIFLNSAHPSSLNRIPISQDTDDFPGCPVCNAKGFAGRDAVGSLNT